MVIQDMVRDLSNNKERERDRGHVFVIVNI
jgi:hypothetical protein